MNPLIIFLALIAIAYILTKAYLVGLKYRHKQTQDSLKTKHLKYEHTKPKKVRIRGKK